jgi:hypothetical protein
MYYSLRPKMEGTLYFTSGIGIVLVQYASLVPLRLK